MEAIDFKTDQNITLSYPKASIGERLGAYVIDLSFLYLFSITIIVISSASSIGLILLFSFMFCGGIIQEILMNGQTLGKRLVKTRVVSINGEAASARQLLTRWIFKLIDILFTFGALGILSILGTPLGQRIGDIIAGTTVVKTKVKSDIELEKLAQMNDISHVITYHKATIYELEDILSIKKMLIRLRQNPTQENINVAFSIAVKVSKDMNVNPPESVEGIQNFLKTIIEDYIVLTR